MNPEKVSKLMLKLNRTVYSEPRMAMHDGIIRQVSDEVLAHMPAGSVALDVGCGCGPFLELCREKDIKAIGIGVDRADLAQCISFGYRVHEMDMHDLQFSDRTFGLVWARHVLEHSPFPLLALSEFRRVLIPGGCLYIEVPAPDTCAHHESNANHYSVFGDKAWQFIFDKAGFKLVGIKFIDIDLTRLGKDKYFSYILCPS